MRLPLLAIFLLPSCGSFYSSSSEEKFAAYSTHQAAWNPKAAPKEFGLARSVQVIEAGKTELAKGRFSYSGGLGMASLVTTDGYAITAAHVVTSPPLDAFPALARTGHRPAPTVHVQRGSPPSTADKNARNTLVAYSPGHAAPRTLRVEEIEIRTLRIVKTFPERDIALVKLPLHTAACFELRNKPLDANDTLFASGNWATPYRGTSAGKVLSVVATHPAATIVRSSAPLAKGDSGGPVFDADGRLVGIASRVIPSRLLPYPKLRHSSLRQFDPATVEALIAADRKAHP